MKRQLVLMLSLIFMFTILVGCNKEEAIENIDIINLPEQIEIGTFDECNIKFNITYSDDTTELVDVKEKDIPEEYQHYLYEEGTHNFSFLYKGYKVKFNITMYEVKYTVKFINVLDEVVKELKVKKNEKVEYPTKEEMYVEGYRFLETYDKDITYATSDVEIKGNYVKTWIVKFYNGLNEVISTQIVDDKSSAQSPSEEDIKIDGYTFIMWDKGYTNITKNTNIFGIYEEINVACEHNIVEATCTNPAYCKKCNTTFGNALGHDFVLSKQKDATCTEDGYIEYKCNHNCGTTKKQIILAYGHDFNKDGVCIKCGYVLENHTHEYKETVKEPTCTSMGYTLYECSCGHTYKDNYIDTSRHNWDEGKIIKQPTCTTNGEKEYKCKDCQATMIHQIKAAHDYKITINKKATCTVDGEYTKECTRCGHKITEIEEAHHTWTKDVVVKQPTCKETGIGKRTCGVCGKEETYVIDKKGHRYVNGICTGCGEHYMDHITTSTHPIYGMYFEIEETISDYGPEIIDEYGLLLDYNKEAKFDKVAVYLTQDGTMWRRAIACTGSNIEYATYVPYLSYGENILYTGLNSNYINIFNLRENSDGIWTYNNYTTIGVNLENNKGDLLLSLSDIGQAGKQTRIFDNLEEMIAWLKNDDICFKCNFVTQKTPATCTEQGYTLHVCTVCGHTFKDTYVDALGHDFIINNKKDATCTEDGYIEYKCSRNCSATKRETILSPGHDLVIAKTPATCTKDGKVITTCKNCTYSEEIIIKGQHNYKITDMVQATCTKNGHITYTCTLCKDEYKEILTSSHNYVETSRIEAQVGKEGSITYTCTRCKDSFKISIPAIDPINSTKSILLIQDTLPWAEDVNRDLLNKLKNKGTIAYYNIITTNDLEKVDLSKYAVVFIANDQTTSMYNRLEKYKDKLANYANIGGILVYGVCDNGWGGCGEFTSSLPGGVTTNNYYSVYNYILNDNHPIVSGVYTDNKELTNELLKGNYCSHTYFNKSSLVDNTNIILMDGNANPTLIEYTYGEGTVIATGLTWEYFYIRNHYNMSTNYSKYAYDDLLTYAIKISQIKSCEHKFTTKVVNPTCEEQGYTLHTCKECGYVYKDTYVDALGHDETDWIIDEDPTCTKEGTKHTECERCGKNPVRTGTLPEIGHNYTSTIIVHPTCTEQGYTLHTCNNCGHTFKDTYVDPSETDWIIDEYPTCTKEGTKHTECEICGKNPVRTGTIPKIDHNYVNNKCTMCGKEKDQIKPYEENGKTYINFGRYPQTVVTDTNLIKELDKITITNEYGYIEYNGNEYKKQVADRFDSYSIFQNGNEVVDGATYYFKVEPIKWRVLETSNGSYKLLSEYLLDTQQFYISSDYRIINGTTIYANNYEYSNIRAWLNGYNGTSYNVEDYTNKGFIDIAFTEEEQAIIKTTLVDNSVSSTGYSENQYACNNTYDKIYLLSLKEATNTTYGFSNSSSDDSSREVQPTDYAAARYCVMYHGKGVWWLRSPYFDHSYSARRVSDYGGINYSYDVRGRGSGVRAALEINLTNNPHNHNYTSTIVNPTCEEEGYTLHTCTVCGNTYKDTYVDALGHDLVIETTPATCTQDGQERTYCKREGCTYEKTKVLPAGHNYTTKVVNPTCEEEGYTLHTCTVCGNTYKDTYVDALGHDETDWIIDEDPTCQKEGTKHTECERCGKNPVRTGTISKIDHNYVNNKCTMCGKEPIQVSLKPYKENGLLYINFGRYPQTVVTDTNLIKKLDKITITNEYGYIEYNGNEYKKQVADRNDSNSIFQNGNEVVDGKTYYFKVEPIKWRVLETSNGSYKLLSEYLLDTQEFYTSINDRTLNEQTIYANNYEYSTIRAWLNGYNGTSYGVEDYTNKGFIDIAFTEEEQAIIKTTLVDNSVSSTGYSENQYACDNTNDKIYLLSYKEATNTTYGFSNSSSSDSSREAKPTDYTAARDCWMYQGNGLWWLRSPFGYYSYDACVVSDSGDVYTIDDVCNDYLGVRAALEINLTI